MAKCPAIRSKLSGFTCLEMYKAANNDWMTYNNLPKTGGKEFADFIRGEFG